MPGEKCGVIVVEGLAVLNWAVKKTLAKTTFGSRSEGGGVTSHVDTWGNSIPGRRT